MRESLALELIENYLKNHKYHPARIETKRLQSGEKSPDFEVKKTGKSKFYCEVKTPKQKLNDKTQMFHWTTTASKLRAFIHTAVKQFNACDPKHSYPWVLIFTSDHFQLNWSNFAHCIRGVVAYNFQIIKDMRNQRFIEETNEDVRTIDLFIWCQVNVKDEKIYQMVHFLNKDSELFVEIKLINKNLIPYASENIMDKNLRKYCQTL